MDKKITGKRDDNDLDTFNGSSQEETPGERSERYRRKVKALNDCMLE
jgi:hypothetical protein